jgi:hypothetical protein
MDYPVESFTEDERAALTPHFTNLDQPVFALIGLPETVKGALFARYSRYQGTLRRLYLDEFAGEGGEHPAFDGEEGERARKLYERIFLGYGDDSVAQLGGAHIACEWVSNVMTKLLQRGRLAAYLEQSTRYIPYDTPIADGLGYRYWRDPPLGPEYESAMDFLFGAYSESLPRTRPPARAVAGGLALARRDVRHGPGVRAAAVAAVLVAAAGGARLRGHDPGPAQGGDAELRGARRAARAGGRVDFVSAGALRGR